MDALQWMMSLTTDRCSASNHTDRAKEPFFDITLGSNPGFRIEQTPPWNNMNPDECVVFLNPKVFGKLSL